MGGVDGKEHTPEGVSWRPPVTRAPRAHSNGQSAVNGLRREFGRVCSMSTSSLVRFFLPLFLFWRAASCSMVHNTSCSGTWVAKAFFQPFLAVSRQTFG